MNSVEQSTKELINGLDELRRRLDELDLDTATSKKRRLCKTLENIRDELGSRVVKRTAELQRANERLHVEIAARKSTEVWLQRSERRYRRLFENSQGILCTHDLDGVVLAINPAAIQMLGYQPHECIGKNLCKLLAPSVRHLFGAYLEQIRQHRTASGLMRVMARDGRELVWVYRNVRIEDTDEDAYVLAHAQDITERVQVVESLQAAKEYAENLINSSLDIIVSVNTQRRIIEFNPAAELAFGYKKADVLGQPVGILFANQNDLQHIRKRILQSGAFTGEVLNQRKNNSTFDAYLSASVMRDIHGKVMGVMGISRDITDRKRLEHQLIQAQKLEAIGQLAAGIAHEINTPLQFVGDNSRFLQEAFQDLSLLMTQCSDLVQARQAGTAINCLVDDMTATVETIDLDYLRGEIPVAIQQSQEGVGRAAAIVRALKEFSHPGTEDKTAINLNQTIESTITVARNEWKYVANLKTDFDATLPLLPCFPSELNQVVLNIIVNAAHAIADVVGDGSGGKGTITVSTRHVADGVEIRIADTGAGIPAAIRDRIFEPFFTTKAVGKGTGQGLAIAHNVVVQKHGGTIACETGEGHGTTFIIRLPLTVDLATHG